MLEQTRAQRETPRGISLIEVLVALAVLGVGLAALAAVVPSSTQGLQKGAQMSIATFLAEQRLEQIASVEWTAVPPNDCVGTSGAGPASWSFDGGVAPRATGSCDGGDTSHPDEGPSGRVDDHPPTRLSGPFGGYTRRARVQPCDAPEATCGPHRPAPSRTPAWPAHCGRSGNRRPRVVFPWRSPVAARQRRTTASRSSGSATPEASSSTSPDSLGPRA